MYAMYCVLHRHIQVKLYLIIWVKIYIKLTEN